MIENGSAVAVKASVEIPYAALCYDVDGNKIHNVMLCIVVCKSDGAFYNLNYMQLWFKAKGFVYECMCTQG